MGNGGSKPEQHVFNADAPVRFSQSVVDSLQNSPDTDSSRAQDVELKIQTRVNSELKRIRDSQAQKLADLTASLTTNAASSEQNPQKNSKDDQQSHSTPNTLFAHLSSPFYSDHTPSKPSPSSSSAEPSDLSHDTVQAEIMSLRTKLSARKTLHKTSPEADKAREKLVQCLRTNDRRPLDCWEEVEGFKREVGKLERDFVERAAR